MKEISKKEFESRGVMRSKEVEGVFEEKRWFEHRALLGALLFDIDGEWAWIVLAKYANSAYRAIDLGTSIATQSIAVNDLAEALVRHEDVVEMPEQRPATKEEAIRILATQAGVSEERAHEIFESVKIPRKGNN